MAGGSGATTVGYKYYMGMHQALCQGPIDYISEIRFQEQQAWTGRMENGRIEIHRPSLFGGEGKEGGVSGFVDVMNGNPSQTVNDYLSDQLGSLVPAFRGVVSTVFRHFYFGNNPYLKPLSYKVRNVFSTYGDWYPEKAAVLVDSTVGDASIYIAMDGSDSMSGTKLSSQYSAVQTFLASLKRGVRTTVSIKLVRYAATANATKTIYFCDDSDFDELIAWIDALGTGTSTGTNYDEAVGGASSFFTTADSQAKDLDLSVNGDPALTGEGTTGEGNRQLRRVLIFCTDGNPVPTSSSDDAATTLASITDLEAYAFNIELTSTTHTSKIDNTPEDGIPVVSGADSDELLQSIKAAFYTWTDINPIHILRDMLLDPSMGGDGDTTKIGTSFTTAADTLYDEGLGVSFLWASPDKKDDFKATVEKHIDGRVFFDRSNGTWEVKLIRNDFTVGSLFTFDASVITDWLEADRPQQEELPNQLKILFTRRYDGEQDSVTMTNDAAIAQIGRIIPTQIEYLGITDPGLASKIAIRELRPRTSPLFQGKFRAAYVPAGLNLGSAVIVNEPRMGIDNVVCRISEIEEGGPDDEKVILTVYEDAFKTPLNELLGRDTVNTASTLLVAQPAVYEVAMEVPYYFLARFFGDDEINADITADNGLGYWFATCAPPTNFHTRCHNAIELTSGAGYKLGAIASLCPYGILETGVDGDAETVTFSLALNRTLNSVYVGQLAYLEGEILRLDAVSVSGSTVTATFGRGVLDTYPLVHQAGTAVLFLDDYAMGDQVEYTATDSVDIKVLPGTATDLYPPAKATPTTIDFDYRAFKPYPPGNLKLDSELWHNPGPLGDNITITWAHRDRTQQTSATPEDFADGNIGPESGTSYVVLMQCYVADTSNWFALADGFTSKNDFFLSATPQSFRPNVTIPESPTTATYNFDLTTDFFTDQYPDTFDVAAVPDFFAEPGGDMLRLAIGVRSVRDSQNSWTTPVVMGTPLLAPRNLTAENF